MRIREALDGLISNYYYRKYMGTKNYVLYFLKNFRKTDLDYLLSAIEMYSSKFNHKYTFFLKGAFINQFPSIVAELHAKGHEIGYHSYYHISSKSQSEAEFEKDMKLGLAMFRKLGIPLRGYRAPHLLFDEKHYAILKNLGFRYSSSKYFLQHPYQIIEGFYEVPVNFLDIFDYKENSTISRIKDKFTLNSIHLYHPYGLLALRNKKKLIDLFSTLEIPVITISELLGGRKGMCITIDIGI